MTYPTDKALFPAETLSAATKRSILNQEPCQPPILNNYYTTYKNQIKIYRKWLCFSPRLNVAYCQDCWLFGGVTEWARGIALKKKEGLLKKISLHERSEGHRSCTRDSVQFTIAPIDTALEKQRQEEDTKWSLIVQRIISVIITASSMNVPLRGHREKVGDGECDGGNFLAMIGLLAQYDDLLKETISTGKGVRKYMSPAIQNELIQLISAQTTAVIVREILESPYFSLIVDSTTDISKVDQLSVVLRYVVHSDKSFLVKESFMGFVAMTSSTADAVSEAALELLDKLNIPIGKIRAQGYDGASVMSGVYNGVQAKIKEKLDNPAPFVHCSAHNLNLVLQDCVGSISIVKDFFDCLGQLYTFIGSSYLRWQEIMGTKGLALKKMCPTRWASRFESVRAVKDRQMELIVYLTKLSLTGDKTSR